MPEIYSQEIALEMPYSFTSSFEHLQKLFIALNTLPLRIESFQ